MHLNACFLIQLKCWLMLEAGAEESNFGSADNAVSPVQCSGFPSGDERYASAAWPDVTKPSMELADSVSYDNARFPKSWMSIQRCGKRSRRSREDGDLNAKPCLGRSRNALTIYRQDFGFRNSNAATPKTSLTSPDTTIPRYHPKHRQDGMHHQEFNLQ